MSTPSRRRTITLRDGARVTLRPIAPEDKPLLAASFDRLSEESLLPAVLHDEARAVSG